MIEGKFGTEYHRQWYHMNKKRIAEWKPKRGITKFRKVSCIWIQVISTPSDPIALYHYPIGTRIFLNKKKAPYLFKYHFLRFKTPTGDCKLYIDEIEMVTEKRVDAYNNPPT